jgi:hypothetical protein
MSEQSEKLARIIRTHAGEHNDPDLGVAQIVAYMRQRIAQLEAELKVLNEIEIARWQTAQAQDRYIKELEAKLAAQQEAA